VTKHLMFAIALAGCYHDAPPPPAAPKVVAVAPPVEPSGPPAGYVEMKATEISGSIGAGAVLLSTETGDLVLPIYIGGTEANSIDRRLHNDPSPRPLTHDLMDSVLRRLHTTIVKVQVDELRRDLSGGTFIGTVYLRSAGKTFHVDARPSDAIALAIGSSAPIYVAQKVLDAAGVPKDQLPAP
jgi:hypothetical protein